MQLAKKYYHGRLKALPNVFIGGVGAVYTTKASLASALGISAGNIPYFGIVGDEVQVKFSVNVGIPVGFSYLSITYLLDEVEGRIVTHGGFNNNNNSTIKTVRCVGVTTIGFQWISGSYVLEEINFPNLVNVPASGFKGYMSPSNIKIINIPKVTNLGGAVGNTMSLTGIVFSNTKIYCNIALKTNNSGGMDGDLVEANSLGARIFFVNTNAAPLAPTISNLVVGGKTVSFIDNGLSANPILYYEVYKNGVFDREVSVSRRFGADPITLNNLTINTYYNNYSFAAVDVSGKKSALVNIPFTTKSSTDYGFNVSGLMNWYKMNDSSVSLLSDSFNSNNFLYGNATYHTAGNSGILGTSITNTGNAFIQAYGETLGNNITINLWLYPTAGGSGNNRTIADYGAQGLANGCGLWLNASYQVGFRYNGTNAVFNSAMALTLNTWTMITATYDGTTVKLYLNGVLKYSYALSVTLVASNERYIFKRRNFSEWITGSLDEVSYWQEALTVARILDLYNGGVGRTV
jgi:hypothetical protein